MYDFLMFYFSIGLVFSFVQTVVLALSDKNERMRAIYAELASQHSQKYIYAIMLLAAAYITIAWPLCIYYLLIKRA